MEQRRTSSYPGWEALADQPRLQRVLGVSAACLFAVGVISAAALDGGGGLKPPITRVAGPPALVDEPLPSGEVETAAPALPEVRVLAAGQTAPETNGHGTHTESARTATVVLTSTSSQPAQAGKEDCPEDAKPSDSAAGSPQPSEEPAPSAGSAESDPPAAQQDEEEPAPVAAVGAGDGSQGVGVTVTEDGVGVQAGPVTAGEPAPPPDGVDGEVGGTTVPPIL